MRHTIWYYCVCDFVLERKNQFLSYRGRKGMKSIAGAVKGHGESFSAKLRMRDIREALPVNASEYESQNFLLEASCSLMEWETLME